LTGPGNPTKVNKQGTKIAGAYHDESILKYPGPCRKMGGSTQEARKETIQSYVLSIYDELKLKSKRVTASDLVRKLEPMFPGKDIVRELEVMRDDELLDYSDPIIEPDTVIRI